MSKIASFVQLILKNYHNWQVCTSQIVRIAYLGLVQSSLVTENEDCQNWQLWTSQIARIGNFGQVRLPELSTLDKCSLLYTEITSKIARISMVTLDKSECQKSGP